MKEYFMVTHGSGHTMKLAKSWLVMRAGIRIFGFAILVCPPAFAQQSGAALYSRHCAQCHDQGSQEVRAPTRSVMAALTADEILRALERGMMAATPGLAPSRHADGHKERLLYKNKRHHQHFNP
jgi:mono/diheme cytochrome c family protein